MQLADGYIFLKHKRILRRVLADTPVSARLTAMPKDIYLYWDTGIANAPEIASICIASWQDANPDWTVHLLDRAAADRLVDLGPLPDDIKPAHRADILRTVLLQQRGGVWADVTVFCHRPLSDWLPLVMLQSDFFAFTRPGGNRLIANWFMAARPATPMIDAYAAKTRRYWAGRQVPPRAYFWHHYLFELMLLGTRARREDWRAMPALSCTGPHLLQRICAGTMPGDPAAIESLRQVPVHKLTYKRGIQPEDVLMHLGRAKA